jgi:hypothetical protein
MRIIFSGFALCIMFSGYAKAQNETKGFEKVFDIIGAPRVFNSSFDKLIRQFDGLCNKSARVGKDQYKYGNVECIKEVDVNKFTISGSENTSIGFIKASFTGADKCIYMKKILTKNFGKPNRITSECVLDWNLKPLKSGGPQRYVGFEASKEDNVVYFSIGEEQGP